LPGAERAGQGERGLLDLAGKVRDGSGEAAPLVVLHPGAGGRHKRWPAARFAALADRFAELGFAIAITQGPADDDAVEAVRSQTRLACPDLLAGLSLDQLAKALAGASLFVGNDSGITHLAALLEVPTVAIFGPFDPAYWAPIGPRVQVIDAGQACPHRSDPREGCRACSGLLDLGLESIWDAIERVLST
ncbi:MAG: glycosyltransferase family 9 protein, partial [Chloroflexota bacterium]